MSAAGERVRAFIDASETARDYEEALAALARLEAVIDALRDPDRWDECLELLRALDEDQPKEQP